MSNNSQIESREKEIVEEFSLFDDPMMQYEYLVDLGNKLPPIPDDLKTAENVVKGCQSTVWLHTEMKQGKMKLMADSNTVITKGIIALLIRVLNDERPEDVLHAGLTFIDKINLRSHLSEQRSNGLSAMIMRIRQDALKFSKSE